LTTLTGSDTFFTNIDSTYTATKWEADIDQAIDTLNVYGKPYGIEIPNMTGTAGSKTVNVTSAEAGAIRAVASAIYAQSKQSGSQSNAFGIGAISGSSSSGTGMGSVENVAKEMAEYLRELDVTVGPDIEV